MQAYNQGFAQVYDLRWSGFAKQVAPLILDFYAGTPTGRKNKAVLDLCCGTGHLSLHFLEKGYKIVGIDLSKPMLAQAEERTRKYLASGQARFIQGDASHFSLAERFGLVVSTFDSLNHLKNERALRRCIDCVHAICEGYFIFDLNTKSGLKRWNSITVDEFSEEALIITHGMYDGQGDKAWTRITGFIQNQNGLFERFDETVYNTVFKLKSVRDMLVEAGWKKVYFARIQNLKVPVDEPEKESRIFIVAKT